MRILSILLLAISWCFALHPNGVTHYQEITINAAQVAETNPHFLYQVKIPRTGSVISACTSSTNVVVYASTTDTTKSPKWVVYTADTLFLYSDQAVSTSTGGSLVVGYGLTVNAVNSASTFTNCGIVQAWLFDEDDGAATVRNYANGSVGTVNSPASISNRKAIFTEAATGPSTNSIITTENELMLPNRTIVTVGKSSATAGTHSYINNRDYSVGGGFVLYTNATNVVAALSPAASVQTPQNAGSRMQIAASISSDNVLKLYTDGVYRAMGNVPTGIYATPSNVIIGGNNTGGAGYIGFNGEIEQIVVYGSELSSENITTNYNMLFTPSTFSALGTVTPVSVTPNQHIDTLQFVCSATGATSYQWYVADTAVTGETDSVITILADSAFYASNPTVYCVVSNGIETFIGFTWTFKALDLLQRAISRLRGFSHNR